MKLPPVAELDDEIEEFFDNVSYDHEDLDAWRDGSEPDEDPEDRVSKQDLLQLVANYTKD